MMIRNSTKSIWPLLSVSASEMILCIFSSFRFQSIIRAALLTSMALSMPLASMSRNAKHLSSSLIWCRSKPSSSAFALSRVLCTWRNLSEIACTMYCSSSRSNLPEPSTSASSRRRTMAVCCCVVRGSRSRQTRKLKSSWVSSSSSSSLLYLSKVSKRCSFLCSRLIARSFLMTSRKSSYSMSPLFPISSLMTCWPLSQSEPLLRQPKS
mmetsp:Transcript_94993/g.205096  ORF Transcript_94993/g.205096 Transcript_94993/m.205096 type:complete len:209 (+) Transcript_94993:221-847(+)